MQFDMCKFLESRELPDLSKKVPSDEYLCRIDIVRREMHSRGLDVCYAYGNEYRPGDPGWLTGYDPHIEPTAVIVGQENVIILGSPDALNYAVEMKKAGEFRSLIGAGIPSADYPGYNWVSLEEAFFEASGKKAENVGILSPAELLPVQERENIQSVISGDVVDLSGWMQERRYHKSEIEFEMMRIAAQIATAGMEAAVKASEPGLLEVQVAACADFVMKWLGADRLGFTTIVMSGSRASVNIGRATDRVIEEGDMVIIGVSARYEGLNSALGRTLVAGANPSNGQKQILEHGAHAFNLAVEKLKYQGRAREVDLASRDYLASVGFEQFYNIGHGIGWTECFEERIVSQDSDYCFPKGVAVQIDVSVKPKPYFEMDAKRVGLRIEDPFIINHEGITERITDLPLLF